MVRCQYGVNKSMIRLIEKNEDKGKHQGQCSIKYTISCIHHCDPSTEFWKDQCTHGRTYILVLGHNVPG